MLLQKLQLVALLVCISATATASAATKKSILSNKTVVVVGGGPVGLYFAALLLKEDPSVSIEILEKEDSADEHPAGKQRPKINTFGIGISGRMKRRLQDVPGLFEKATTLTAGKMVTRDDLVSNMRQFLAEKYAVSDKNITNFRISFGEKCSSIDFSGRRVTTSQGRTLYYDLLVGADGIHSKVRRLLLDQEEGARDRLRPKHYTYGTFWKALPIPHQPEDISFWAIRHPKIKAGGILPRAPKGYFLVLFWNSEHHDPDTGNPLGILTAEDWNQFFREAVFEPPTTKIASIRTWLFGRRGKRRENKVGNDSVADSTVIQEENPDVENVSAAIIACLEEDERLISDFAEASSRPNHHLELEEYHYAPGRLALIGESAHCFSFLQGQGLAIGLESTRKLVKSLLLRDEEDDESSTNNNSAIAAITRSDPNRMSLDNALAEYSETAIIESHAMTEIALAGYAFFGGTAIFLQAFPFLLWNKLRRRSISERLPDITVPYSTIHRENKRLLQICRRCFEEKRLPFEMHSKRNQ